jgi:uracil-DNA glycosylase family 4
MSRCVLELEELNSRIVNCYRCPRLVAWRESVAQNPPRRFAGEKYWARPIPGFGDANARLLIIGLAPAAHGGNRTGRVFTGDRSGDWMFRALHKAGFANQPTSTHRDDGLKLKNCYISATCRCAPPDNKPLPEEIENCREYLLREMRLLPNVRVLLGLGKIGFDAAFNAARHLNYTGNNASKTPRPRFSHGVEIALSKNLVLMGTYHPSQQNTFTGKLTEPMFDAIFTRIKYLVD